MSAISKIRFAAAVIMTMCICVFFAGCSTDTTVDTLLSIDESYAGARVMTCSFSRSFGVEEGKPTLDSVIEKHCPAQMTYTKQENGYQFAISFSSRAEYVQKISALLGTQPTVLIAQPDTIFTSGIRISEDFNSADLFGWLRQAIEEEGLQNPSNIQLQCGKTEICLNGKTQRTENEITLNDVSGCYIDKILINTVHHDDRYDRTITFRIPYQTVRALGEDIVSYMNARVSAQAKTEWKDFTNGREYKITYENISAQQLLRSTAMLFNAPVTANLSYGADEDGSTPFVNQNLYDETLDLSSYIGKNGGYVPLEYTYSMQGNTTLSGSKTYHAGKWKSMGSVQNNSSTLISNAADLHIRIADAVVYKVDRTNITLSCEGKGNFERTVAFHFSQEQAQGAKYAADYLKARDSQAVVTQNTADGGADCTVTVTGDAGKVSRQMTALFGENNVLTYQSEGGGLDVHNATKMKDSIHMSGLYLGGNQKAPITYSVRTNGKEQLNSLSYASEHIVSNVNLSRQSDNYSDGVATFTLNSADTEITYNGYTPRALGIAVYFLAALCVIAAAVFIIVLVKRHGDGKPPLLPRLMRKLPEPEEGNDGIDDILSKI